MSARRAWALWGAIAVAAFAYLEHQRSPATYFSSEWTFVQERRGWGFDGFVQPYNENLVSAAAFIYRALFEVVGLTHYRPVRLVGLAFHLFAASMVFAYTRSRTNTVLGLAAGAVVAMLGSGFQVLFFPAALTHSAAVGLGLAAWLCLDRRTARGDLTASATHLVSLLFSSIAVGFTVGSAARLACKREWRRAAVVVGPSLVLYGAWFAVWGEPRDTMWSNARHLPSFVATMVGGGAAGLFGRSLMWGFLLAGALIGMAVARGRRAEVAVAPMVTLLTTAALLCLARADIEQPDASRYVYVAAVLLMVAMADLLRHTPLPGWTPFAATCLAVAAIVGNLDVLQRGADDIRRASAITAAELRAVEWARDTVDPDFRPDPQRLPQVTAGAYLDAVSELGSPAWTDDAVLGADASVLQYVDLVSSRALGLGGGGMSRAAVECSAVAYSGDVPVATGTTVTLIAWYAPVELRFRRLADEFAAEPTAVVPAGSAVVFDVPADDAPVEGWTMQALSIGDFGLCT